MPVQTAPRGLALEIALIVIAALVALAFRPWSTLRAPALRNPWFAALAMLALLWGVQQRLLPQGLPQVLSGACLLVLMFGWPLAVLTLLAVAATAVRIAGGGWPLAVDLAAWSGVVPATAGLAIGIATRRWLPKHLFVYILGRAFAGTALATGAGGALWIWWSSPPPAGADMAAMIAARWLMAWGEAFATGGLTAIFVAFKPEWLLTYSDARYLPAPGK